MQTSIHRIDVFPQALSGFDSPLYKKQKAPYRVALFFGADEGKT